MQEHKKTAAEELAYDRNNLKKNPTEFYMEKYQEANPEEISARLSLPYDQEKKIFTFRFLGIAYAVSYPDLAVQKLDTSFLPGCDPLVQDAGARILVLRYLLQAKKMPFQGKFLSFREYPSGELYFQPFQGRCIFRLNGKYGRRPEVFKQVMEAMGAKKTDYADACYDVELFDGLYVRFILWEADEEFPPSSQILFSDTFLAAFEAYDLAEIGGICINAFASVEKEINS